MTRSSILDLRLDSRPPILGDRVRPLPPDDGGTAQRVAVDEQRVSNNPLSDSSVITSRASPQATSARL